MLSRCELAYEKEHSNVWIHSDTTDPINLKVRHGFTVHVTHLELHPPTHPPHTHTCKHTHTWQPWGYLRDRTGGGARRGKGKRKE